MDQRKMSEGIFLDYGGSEIGDGHLVMHLTISASTKLPWAVMRHLDCDLYDAINDACIKTFRSVTGVGAFCATKCDSPIPLCDQEVPE